MKVRRNIIFMITFIFEPISALLKLSPPWKVVVHNVNENYSVKCEGEGEKIWKDENGQIINERSGSSISTTKKQPENTLYLKFSKIQKEHKGMYTCSTSKGNKYAIGFELIVIKPVTFLNTPTESIIYNEGEEVILDCAVDGVPPPEISWFFEDNLIKEWFPITNYKNESRSHSLIINNASGENSGTYICRAFQNILQTRNAEQIYHLKIRHKPTQLSSLETSSIVYGFKNERRNITCIVTAYPEAYFIWYRDNVPIDPKKSRVKIYYEENTSILEVKLTDSAQGSYDCVAANPLGMFTQTIELKLIDKPETPKLLKSNLTFSSVVISVLPYPAYEFIKFRIQYTEHTYCSEEEKWKQSMALDCRNERVPNTNKTRCKIDNLKQSTKYAVRATIINKGGPGNFSEELFFRTSKDPSLSSAMEIQKSNFIIFIYLFCYIYFFK